MNNEQISPPDLAFIARECERARDGKPYDYLDEDGDPSPAGETAWNLTDKHGAIDDASYRLLQKLVDYRIADGKELSLTSRWVAILIGKSFEHGADEESRRSLVEAFCQRVNETIDFKADLPDEGDTTPQAALMNLSVSLAKACEIAQEDRPDNSAYQAPITASDYQDMIIDAQLALADRAMDEGYAPSRVLKYCDTEGTNLYRVLHFFDTHIDQFASYADFSTNVEDADLIFPDHVNNHLDIKAGQLRLKALDYFDIMPRDIPGDTPDRDNVLDLAFYLGARDPNAREIFIRRFGSLDLAGQIAFMTTQDLDENTRPMRDARGLMQSNLFIAAQDPGLDDNQINTVLQVGEITLRNVDRRGPAYVMVLGAMARAARLLDLGYLEAQPLAEHPAYAAGTPSVLRRELFQLVDQPDLGTQRIHHALKDGEALLATLPRREPDYMLVLAAMTRVTDLRKHDYVRPYTAPARPDVEAAAKASTTQP